MGASGAIAAVTGAFLVLFPRTHVRLFMFFIIIGPVGSYFAGGINPLKLRVEEKYVRSAPGGTGFAKTGGNYAASLLPIDLAQAEGYDNIIWLDAKTRNYVEEMGAMNIAFVYEDKVITAPTGDTILNGVTRDSVGQLLKDMDLNWVEEHPAIAEIIEDAYRCLDAGASIIHAHNSDYQLTGQAAADDYLAAWKPVFEKRPAARVGNLPSEVSTTHCSRFSESLIRIAQCVGE